MNVAERKRYNYEQWLANKCKGLAPLKTAVVHPADVLSIAGAVEAAEQGIIDPVLIGPEEKIRAAAAEAKVNIAPFRIIVTAHSHAAAAESVRLAAAGEVEALMKGKLATEELLEAVVPKEAGLRSDRRMSHVFVMDVPSYDKPLLLTDAAVNIRPTLMEKRDIVQNAVDLFHVLSGEKPRVAVLAAIELVNPNMPATVDAAALSKMGERGQIYGALVDGPLAFDNAISPEATRIKGIISEVAGQADILIAPEIESGNMIYKQLRYFSGAQGAGIVLGAAVPIILTSRAGDAESRVASCQLALIYAHGRKEPVKTPAFAAA